MTNLEKIRTMSAEELAKYLDMLLKHCANGYCNNCPLNVTIGKCDFETLKEWLLKEVEE